MDRALIIGIDGLNRLIELDNLEKYPALKKLIDNSASGKLENEVPLSWELSWYHALAGIQSTLVDREGLITEFLPYKGISVQFIASPFSSVEDWESSSSCPLKRDQEYLLKSISKDPVDRVDLMVIALNGLDEFCKIEGSQDEYWAGIDSSLAKLLEGQTENTIVILFTPNIHNTTNKGILINQWLIDKGYALTKAQGESKGIDTEKSLCWYDASINGLRLAKEYEEEKKVNLINDLRQLKVYAKRGGDLKTIAFEDVYSNEKQENDPDIYLTSKKTDVYLSASLSDNKENGSEYSCSETCQINYPEGMIYVSGYKVEPNKDLTNISLLALAPTIMDYFNIRPIWQMQRHSFKYQFIKKDAQMEQADSDDAGAAVRSRLEALGY